MDINRFSGMLILILIVAPVALVGVLRLVARKRSGIGSGWGGVLFIGLCWLIAMVAILDRVR